MSSDPDFLSVSELKQAGVAGITWSTRLDRERSCGKERAKSECKGRTCSSAPKIRCRSGEDDPRYQPPKRRPPHINARRKASGVCQRSPEQRLPPTRAQLWNRRPAALRIHKLTWVKASRQGGLADKVEHAFQMVGLGEQIHQVRFLYPISGLEQKPQVAGQGSRIARDVGDMGRSQRSQDSAYAFA
jgi:hypothetical protein